MFPLDVALSGHLAARVIEVLLVDAGYQVVPLGIERTIRELRTAVADRYRGIAPPRLRSLPDFFVIDPDANQGFLVEVKYRRYLHSKLAEDLSTSQEHWASLVLILAIAEPPAEWTGAVRHLRLFRIKPRPLLTTAYFSGHDARMQDVCPRLGLKWPDATIRQAQDFILRIAAEG